MPNVEPQWQCTNCRAYNHHSQTYCPYCYELAPVAHTIAPAKFGPHSSFEAPTVTAIEWSYGPDGPWHPI